MADQGFRITGQNHHMHLGHLFPETDFFVDAESFMN